MIGQRQTRSLSSAFYRRLRVKQYPQAVTATYQWDGCFKHPTTGQMTGCGWDNRGGRLWAKVAPDETTWWASFDARGRVSAETWKTPTMQPYTVTHTYNAMDQESSTTYLPENETIGQTYQGGQLARMYSVQTPPTWRGLDFSFAYNPQGQPKTITQTITSPNNTTAVTRYGYWSLNQPGLGGDGYDTSDATRSFGRLWQIHSGSPSARNIKLYYDDAGNVTQQSIAEDGNSPENLFYTYDALNRLQDMKNR